jgi:hypothetical protein
MAVAVPLVFLAVALMARTTLSVAPALLVVLGAIVLLLQGGIKNTMAQVQLAQAIRARSADSPPLDRMKKGQIFWQEAPMVLSRTPFGSLVGRYIRYAEDSIENSASESFGVDDSNAASADNVQLPNHSARGPD